MSCGRLFNWQITVSCTQCGEKFEEEVSHSSLGQYINGIKVVSLFEDGYKPVCINCRKKNNLTSDKLLEGLEIELGEEK